MELLRDPLLYMTRDEIISQFEDRSAHCKKCGSLRHTIPLNDMQDFFVEFYKEKCKDDVFYEYVTFKYCEQCQEYDEKTESIFREINQINNKSND